MKACSPTHFRSSQHEHEQQAHAAGTATTRRRGRATSASTDASSTPAPGASAESEQALRASGGRVAGPRPDAPRAAPGRGRLLGPGPHGRLLAARRDLLPEERRADSGGGEHPLRPAAAPGPLRGPPRGRVRPCQVEGLPGEAHRAGPLPQPHQPARGHRQTHVPLGSRGGEGPGERSPGAAMRPWTSEGPLGGAGDQARGARDRGADEGRAATLESPSWRDGPAPVAHRYAPGRGRPDAVGRLGPGRPDLALPSSVPQDRAPRKGTG